MKNNDNADIILLKDHNKFLIKDLEQMEHDTVNEKLNKRKH